MKKLLYVIPFIHCLLTGWLLVDAIRFAIRLIGADWSVPAENSIVSLYCLWGIEINDFIFLQDAPKYLLYLVILTVISAIWSGFVCIMTHERVTMP